MSPRLSRRGAIAAASKNAIPTKGITLSYVLDDTDSDNNRRVSEMVSAGVQIARMDANSVNDTEWTRTLHVIDLLKAAGIEPQLMWGSSNLKTTSSIATVVAARAPDLVGKGIRYVEFHNEQNQSGGSWGTPDSAGYIAGLKTFYDSMKSVSSSFIILAGGLASEADTPPSQYSEPTFLQAMIDAAVTNGYTLASICDGICVHPYLHVNPSHTWSPWYKAWSSSTGVRAKMDANGMSAYKIYIGESGSSVSEADRFSVINEVYTFFRRTDVGPLGFWMPYSVETTDGYALWPSGVGGAAAAAFTLIPGTMPAAFGQSDSLWPSTAGTTTVKQYIWNILAGSCLWCVVAWNSTSVTCAVSDDINGAWTACGSPQNGAGAMTGWRLQFFIKVNSAAGKPTVTATFTGGSPTRRGLAIHEYAGIDTSSPIDDAVKYSTPTGTTPSTQTVTTTHAKDIIVGACVASGAGGNGDGSNQARREDDNWGANQTLDTYKTATGTYSLSFTNVGGTDSLVGILALKGVN